MEADALVSSWIDWRAAMGRAGSRHRRAVLDRLKTAPALLYYGDSWFSTPLYPNLARQSLARIDGIGMVSGKPGATAAQLFTPAKLRSLGDRLANNPFDLLLVSGGGNDALGDRLERVFRPWLGDGRPKIDAAAAFARLLDSGVFEGLRQDYERLLRAVAPVRMARPWFRVIAHGYAPLVRIGVPADLTTANIGLIALLKDDVGPWLWGPMRHVLPDRQAAKDFADRLLLDGFRDRVLVPVRDAHPALFDFADFSTLPALRHADAWYDEIHPGAEGFAAMAPVLNARVRAALPEGKRAAVH